MSTTTELLDRLKAAQGISSDYALAKLLGISKQGISHYRTKSGQLDTSGVFRIAELLGMSHAETLAALASIEAERAKDEQTRATWQARLKRLGGIAATVTVAALGIGASAPADAAQNIASHDAARIPALTVFRSRRTYAPRCPSAFATLVRLIFQQLKAPQHFAPAA